MTSSSQERGAALVVVLSVLTMLLVIATPFLLQARKDQRNAIIAAERQRARTIAETALGHARARLELTHQGLEAQQGGFKTPYWDGPEELAIDSHPESWRSLLGLGDDDRYMGNPRGDMWSIDVRDEQAFINADTAPPFLWGALVGRTTLSSDYEPSSGQLQVESTEGFASKGKLVIGVEVVEYQRAKGNTISGVKLQRNYPAGTIVLNHLAYELAKFNYASPRANGGYVTMPSPTVLKEVASYAKQPLTEDRLDDVFGPLTVHGYRPTTSGWLATQQVISDIEPQNYEPATGGQPLIVRNPDYFNRGTVVKITDGATTEYNIVNFCARQGEQGRILLQDQISKQYLPDTATISAEMRHPVNINLCSPRVLELLLTDLQWRGSTSGNPYDENRVSPDLAAEIAQVVVKNRPIRGIEHFVDLLAALYHVKQGSFTENPESTVTSSDVAVGGSAVFTPAMALAVVQNALNPCHRELFGSTMPFTFTSHDYFTVETQASVNDAGGTERARARLRETFKTAPPREIAIRLDTQADFEEAVVSGRQGRFVESYPEPLSFFTNFTAKPEPRYLRNMLYFDSPDRRGIFANREEGEVRLQPSRLQVQPGGFEEHFDGDLQGAVTVGQRVINTGVRPELIVPEGWPLTNGAFELPLTGRGNAGALDQLGLNPFVVEMYMKPEAWGQGPVMLSVTGADPASDFIRAWYDITDRALHLKVHDNTIDSANVGTGAGGAIEEAAEVVWQVPQALLEDDTWYHFAMHIGGSRPGDIVLEVDGRKVGQSRFASRLTRNFSQSASQFEVEDATGWPDEGLFWVGNEVVAATRTSGNTYTVFDNPNGANFMPFGRGARGTDPVSHNQGESVRLFGYSMCPAQRTTNMGGEVISEGGGTLTADLLPLNCCGVMGNQNESIMIGQNSFSVETLDLTAVNQIDLMPFPNEQIAVDQETFQANGGYAILVAAQVPTGSISNQNNLFDASSMAVVMLRYTSRQGNRLQGVQAVADPLNPTLVHGQPLMQNGATFLCQTLPKIVTRFGGGGPQEPPRCAIFPISVALNDVEGFRDVELTNNGPAIEYVQIGNPQLTPTLSSFANYALEWVGYYGVDRQNGMLVCNPRQALGAAAEIIRVNSLLGGNNNGMPTKPDLGQLNALLQFRSQAQTEQFQFNIVGNANSIHTSGTAGVPTFFVSPVAATSSVEFAVGFGDQVTLISPIDRHRSRRSIAWGWNYRAAFTTNSAVRINQIDLPQGGRSIENVDRRRYTRLVKFPSGEMPNIVNAAEAWVGGDSAAALTAGLIDEVRMRRLPRERYVVWDDLQVGPLANPPTPYPLAVSDSDSDIPVVRAEWIPDLPVAGGTGAVGGNILNSFNWLTDGRELRVDGNTLGQLPSDAGLIVIGDELIAYRNVDPGGILQDCERGFLGTVATAHSYGEDVAFLDWRAVSKLANQVQPEDYNVIVGASLGFNPNGGTVLIGREMMHYTRTLGPVLIQPRAIDRQSGNERGIFRGRYGTLRGSHSTDDIVLDMPFRYWDRYAPDSDDPELGFYEFAVNEPRAFFRRLEWTHRFPKPRLGMKVVCRFDPTLPWETPPSQSGGRIVVFDSENGQTQDFLNRALLNVDGRGIDVRVFFTYEQNAFDPVMFNTNDWKETARLMDFTVAYLAAPLVLKREVLR